MLQLFWGCLCLAMYARYKTVHTPRDLGARVLPEAAATRRRRVAMRPTLSLLTTLLIFFDTFAVGLVNPIYPLLVQSDRLGATLYSALISVANGGALLAGTAFGHLSDLHGRQVAIIASCTTTLLGFACYAAGTSFSIEHHPAWRLAVPAVGRVLSGIGREAMRGPVFALISEDAAARSDEAATTRRMAMTMATWGVGFSVGSGVGGWLVVGGGHSRSLTLILCSAVIQLLCALQLHRAPSPPPPTKATKAANSRTGESVADRASWSVALRAALTSRSTRLLLLLQATASASFQVYDATSALYLKDALHYTPAHRGYLLAFAGWAFAAQCFFVVPRLAARYGASVGGSATLLRFAFVCTAVGRLGLAAAAVLPPTLMIVLSYLVLNLGQGMTNTLIRSLVRDAAEDGQLGLTLGVLGSVERSMGVAAPLISGPAYERLGPPSPALLAALLGTFGCLLTGWLDGQSLATRRAKRKSKEE